jgi:dihydrofolate reductase
MRKVILNLALSLDGFIEGPNGEYDWCFTDKDYGMTRFLSRVDAVFFGRKSFELVSPMGPNAYPKLARYVFSRSLKSVEGATIINEDVKLNVERIKRMKGKDIWLFGGADLTKSLLDLDLIDEMQLSVHPIILGEGKPLFKGSEEHKKLKLMGTRTYSTGLVQLFYRPLRKLK